MLYTSIELSNKTTLTYHGFLTATSSFFEKRPSSSYIKYDIQCLIIFSVVTTISCSPLIFNSLIINVRHKCAATFLTATSFLLLSLMFFFHILTNTKSMHVTSMYYHSWYLMLEFTFNVTCFHRVNDIQCMHSYLVYQTLNIIFSVLCHVIAYQGVPCV